MPPPPDIETPAAANDATVSADELKVQNAALRKQIASLSAQNAELETLLASAGVKVIPPEMRALVNEKVRAGLPMDHAIAVARSQLVRDKEVVEENKRAEAEKAEKAKKAAAEKAKQIQ